MLGTLAEKISAGQAGEIVRIRELMMQAMDIRILTAVVVSAWAIAWYDLILIPDDAPSQDYYAEVVEDGALIGAH